MTFLTLYSSSLSLWLQSLDFNLPQIISRRNMLQQARSQTLSRSSSACKLAISRSFHSPSGVLFTFPSRYYFTIGYPRIFSLTRWSSQIHTEFHVFHVTWESLTFRNNFWLQDCHFLGYSFPTISSNHSFSFYRSSHQPSFFKEFRLFPFRSPLLRESFLLFFPLGTKMFQFPRFALSYL